jgi:hypothetical protein
VEQAVLRPVALHPQSESWTALIIQFQVLPGFLVKIESSRGMVGSWHFDGTVEDVEQTIRKGLPPPESQADLRVVAPPPSGGSCSME